MASSSQYCPRWKYDVFLSFRGEDTRKTFTSHLYEGLRNRGIFTFQDDKRLEHGDSIPQELLKAIIESQVALVVFSKNYATSRWCLNELEKIMECKSENGQMVIPVFYDVDPSHKVQGWRTVLTAAANLKGYDIRDGIESENIQQIVNYISSKLCKIAYSSSSLQDIVGINAHLEKVKSLLKIEIDDVRMVGIWGIGGVGKTTIAKAIFDTLSYQFEAACFLEDVKENATKSQLHSLQNTLLSELLRQKYDYANDKYCGKRLISRVVVTTRNRHLIEKDDAIYEVPTLPDHESMELFNQHAFKKEVPDERFKNFSLEVVNHAKGLPLALKVWGSLLHKKSLTQWRSTVDQIKKNSSSEIVKKLKISYDGLEPEEQKIFLDMACFFRGDEKKVVIEILESCDFGAEYGLDVLIDKSLVNISKNDRVEMHDLIQDMGRYVVKMQKDSGKQSRLWDAEDFEEVMVNNTGTKSMEAIWLQRIQKLRFSKKAMKKMIKLRILHIGHFVPDQLFALANDDSIEYLPNSLCWFDWHGYPWESLRENFEPKGLVHLDLQYSFLHHLWIGTKHLPFLRKLNLSFSGSLRWTPDFTGMPNLEYLNLMECKSLEEVHHSLGCCSKLIELDLDGCKILKKFPCVNGESLESLYLYGCSSLEEFPEILGRIKPGLEIKVKRSGIRELPSSIQYLTHITKLDLSSLENLVTLPSSICKLKGLMELNVSYCLKLESFPEEIGDLENLKELHATFTQISRPPSSIVRLNKLKSLTFQKSEVGLEDRVLFVFPQVNEGLSLLDVLRLDYCNLIDEGLPEDIGCLSSLKMLNLSGNNFKHLPRSIAQLGALQSLDLSYCKRLKELPDFMEMQNLKTLNLSYCKNLEEVHHSVRFLKNLHTLILTNCIQLKRFPGLCIDSLRYLCLRGCSSLEKFPKFLRNTIVESEIYMLENVMRELEFPLTFSQEIVSLSQRVFSIVLGGNKFSLQQIPSWFHHRGMDKSVSVNLPENWYVPDNFLGFAVCYSGRLADYTTAHLIPLCDDDGMPWKLDFFYLPEGRGRFSTIHLFLLPLASLWDTSKANGKTPNDYGLIRLCFKSKIKRTNFCLRYYVSQS
uniref:ADP-ribosyl cyclase/cyclic ADP-ribose hydrolase n=2 Tax=Solanum tuberosum TaxID=4113 RepID=M1D0W4_SOLTU